MPKPRRSTATVVHSTPNPGGSPCRQAREPGSEARPDAPGAPTCVKAEGSAPRDVKSGRAPPVRADAPRATGAGGASRTVAQAVAGLYLDGLQALGALLQLELDRLPSSRLR